MEPEVEAPAHVHEWEPLPRWWARYRCKGCKAVGFKGKAVAAGMDGRVWFDKRDGITLYKCRAKDCTRAAQVIGRRVQVCFGHAGPQS